MRALLVVGLAVLGAACTKGERVEQSWRADVTETVIQPDKTDSFPTKLSYKNGRFRVDVATGATSQIYDLVSSRTVMLHHRDKIWSSMPWTPGPTGIGRGFARTKLSSGEVDRAKGCTIHHGKNGPYELELCLVQPRGIDLASAWVWAKDDELARDVLPDEPYIFFSSSGAWTTGMPLRVRQILGGGREMLAELSHVRTGTISDAMFAPPSDYRERPPN